MISYIIHYQHTMLNFIRKYWLPIAVIVTIFLITVGGTISYIYILKNFKNRYAEKYAIGYVTVPVQIMSALIVVVLIMTMIQQFLQLQDQNEQELRSELSNFTQQIIVGRWEHDAKNTPELTAMYDDIHFSYLSPPEDVIRRKLKKLGVPYVTKEENPQAWHFAAQYIQEMVNVVRKFQMEKKFMLNDVKARDNVNNTAFAGWFQCFRTYMATPTIRNVWERYKYRHVDPSFTAWVGFYVIEPIHKPLFWKQHRQSWDLLTNKMKQTRIDEDKMSSQYR